MPSSTDRPNMPRRLRWLAACSSNHVLPYWLATTPTLTRIHTKKEVPPIHGAYLAGKVLVATAGTSNTTGAPRAIPNRTCRLSTSFACKCPSDSDKCSRQSTIEIQTTNNRFRVSDDKCSRHSTAEIQTTKQLRFRKLNLNKCNCLLPAAPPECDISEALAPGLRWPPETFPRMRPIRRSGLQYECTPRSKLRGSLPSD